MTVWHLAAREIRYRRLNFALSVTAVAVAAACLVGQLAILHADDQRTQRVLAGLEDDVRKITMGLGYNVLIIDQTQDLRRFYRDRYASTFMPERYVDDLASAETVTIQHLLPTLREEIEWPEKKYPIVLIGTRDEVPPGHRDPKKPLQEPVPEGSMVVGQTVGRDLGLKVGQEATLLGEPFKVIRVYPLRNNEDDYTVWIHLHQAQRLLGHPGQINAILALSCFCAEATPEGIRREITRALPKTQVVILTREEAARRAARARAVAHTEEVERQRAAFARWVLPLVVVGATVWVGLLAFTNVRDRRGEVAILRAVGVGARQILGLFLAKAVLVGLVGAAAGFLAGWGIGVGWGAAQGGLGGFATGAAFALAVLGATLLLAPLLAAAASLVPALLAAQQDPADILREE